MRKAVTHRENVNEEIYGSVFNQMNLIINDDLRLYSEECSYGNMNKEGKKRRRIVQMILMIFYIINDIIEDLNELINF